jgi:hypothetical protein
VVEQTAAARCVAHQRTAEALVQETILPALALVQDELHRPGQQHYVTITLRRLEQVNGEALLIAAGQNLKRLLSRDGWGRRPWPSGAAGIVLLVLPPLVALTP